MNKAELERYRYFLKDTIRKEVDFSTTDQSRGIMPPPIEKPYEKDRATTVDLPDFNAIAKKEVSLFELINRRRSHRNFLDMPMSLQELSFLLYATQGIQKVINPAVALRTVPSAGCRHALETYLCVINVEGLKKGIYRYLPLRHSLLLVRLADTVSKEITTATLGQSFTGRSAVDFIWTTIPYRMEWRYGLASHKVIALDAGHVCQNLYLCADLIDCGVCAIAAYDQQAMDRLVEVDGQEEFVIYIAAVGKIHKR